MLSSLVRLLFVPLGCGLLLVASAASAQTNLVQNSGFETGDFAGWTLSGNNDGNTSVNSGNSHTGAYSAYFGSVGSDAVLTQLISTKAGDSYTFSYYLASGGTSPNDFSASFGGSTIFAQTSIPFQSYTQYSYTEAADSASTAIQFAGHNDNAVTFLDDVSVVDAGSADPPAAPEPSAVAALAVTGLGILGLRLRRKKAAAA